MANVLIKTKEEIAHIRAAGQIVGSLLFELQTMVKPGVLLVELDRFAREFIAKRGGQPAFLGYQNYPATLCISVNDAVVHGIPSDVPLLAGDVVGIDAGAIVDGWYADAAITIGLQPIDPENQRLLEVTQMSLAVGIERARAGRCLGDIQAAIQAVIDEAGFGIIRDLTGHGIGRSLHEEPQIPNFGRLGTGLELKPGMTICLEPMVTLGSPEVIVDRDGWTIRTRDGSSGAQFEHTILITKEEPEILTPLRPWPRPTS